MTDAQLLKAPHGCVDSSMFDRYGSVFHAGDDGLGYIVEDEAGTLYTFTYDHIVGYRG